MKQVFISYAHIDNDFAENLKTRLVTAGIPIWLDVERLRAGDDWRDAIDEAIQSSFAMVVIISPAADQSKYVTYEWAYAFGLGIRIIPILLKKVDNGHPRLLGLHYEDFSGRVNRPYNKLIELLQQIQLEVAAEKGSSSNDTAFLRALDALKSWKPSEKAEAAKVLGTRGSKADAENLKVAIDGLIDAVNDPDEIVRIAAIEALGRLKSTAAAPVLLDFLGNYELYEDEYSQLSDVLFEALDAVIDVPSIPTLEVLLNSSSYFARETSIRLLGKIKANSAIPQLMNILLDAPEGLRDVIFSALDEFANVSKPLEALSSSNPDKQQEAVEMLAEEYQTLGLLSALGYYRNKAQWATVTKLEKIITLADNTILIKALDSEVAAVRAFVAEVLGRRSDFEACDELLVLINDESSLVRGLAIRAVERLQCKTARSLLVARLKDTEKIFSDGEKRVCDFAAIALGKFGDKAAIDGLLTTLSGTDNELRIEATKLLGDLADKTISPKLRVVLSENNQAIREAALNVLSRIEFPSTSKTLLESLSDDAYSSRAEALDKIWSVAGTLGLITALDYGKSNVRWEISEKLVEVATLEDKDFFLEALKSNRLSLRAYAAETVGRRPDMQIAVHLYPLIDDEDTFVRGIAIRAIGRLGEKAAGALLKDRLNDSSTIFSNASYHICDFAAIALGKLGEPIAVPHLLNILAAGYDNIREEAVALLSQLADKSISPRLLELLKGTNQAIRESALNVLSKIEFPSDTETLLEALKNDDYWARNQILEKIVKVASVSGLITALGYNNSKASWQIAEKLAAHTLSPEDKDMLLACLRSEVVRIRAFVVEALGRRDDIELGTQLQPLIQDQNSLVCALAIRAVGRLQQQDAIPLLKEKLEDTTIIFSNSDEIVSDEAAIALGKLNELSAIPKLLAALNRSGQQVRDEAVPLLIRFGGKSLVPQLLNILEGGTEGTAESASKVIMAISDKTITGKLIKLLPNNQWYVRYRAIELLGYYGKETTKKKLHEFIEDENEKVQKITVFSLMRLGDLSILSKLTSYTIHENWEIRKEVAELIEEIKEPSTSGILLELLRDDDSDVRAAAIKASKYYNDAQIVRGLIDALNDESYTMRGEQICELTKESLGAIGTVDALEAVVSWENRREASQPEGPGDTPF